MALTLDSLSPTQANLGSTDPITVTLSGSGFVDGTTQLLVNGAPDTFTYVSDTQGTTVVEMATVTVASQIGMALTDGTDTTPELMFEVRDAGPIPPTPDEIPPAESYDENDDTYGLIAEE